jgi:hypothetical protein
LALLRSELAERLPDSLLEGGDGIRGFCESALGLALAEAQAPEGLKGFGPYIGSGCANGGAVGRPVRVREVRRGSRPRNDEPAPVDGEVMGTAKRDEILGVVVATFGPKPDVMRLRKRRVPTARDATSSAIAT